MRVSKKELQKSLRIALSQCQKLRTACSECDRALKERALSPERHKDLIHRYHYDIQIAEAAVAKIRTQCNRYLDELVAEQKRLQEKRNVLLRQVAQNSVPGPLANDLNRKSLEELASMDADIAFMNQIRAARNADELGGFIDLPLDRYAALLPPVIPQVPTGHLWLTLVLSAFAIASVFMPWTWSNDQSISLFTWVRTNPPANGLNWIWSIWLVLPLFAPPFAMRRKSRLAGWGLLVNGLILFAAGLLPGLAWASWPLDASYLSSFLQIYHAGSMLYSMTGVALVYLGAQRVAPSANTLSATFRQAAVAGGILLVSMGVLLAASAFMRSAPNLEFEATLSNPTRGLVNVVIRNNGSQPRSVSIPRQAEAEAEFGVEVYARVSGEDDFRPIPMDGDVWRFRGESVGQGTSVPVQPRFALSLLLDMYEIRRTVPEADAVEIRFVRGSNAVQNRIAIPIPERLVGPREVRRATPPVRSPAPLPEPPPDGDRIEPPVSPVPSQPSIPQIWVKYVGSVGDRHIFRFESSGQEMRLTPGDDLMYPWRLEQIAETPPTAEFINGRTGETIRVGRGQSGAFPGSPQLPVP
ncbi:MAG: hypothetical protein AMXMBFR84_13370 [Candidatus Hydrogenedentota bacterium]